MLALNNVRVHLQNFGTILGIFLVGKSKEDIQRRYFSFYNHEATGGDLEWWCDNDDNKVALFWIYSSKARSADEKLRLALVRAAHQELLKRHTKGTNPWPKACDIAQARYESIERVTWFKSESVWDMFDMGDSVTAEKGTGNFDDDVLGAVVTRGGNDVLDANKQEKVLEENEEEAISEGV